MEERRLLIAVALSLLVLTAYQFLFPPGRPRPAAVPSGVPRAAVGSPTVSPVPGTERTVSPSAPAVVVPSGRPSPATTRVADERERRVEVNGREISVAFSNRGARLVSWRLERFRDAAGKPEEMVHAAPGGARALEIETGDPALDARLREALFQPSAEQVTLPPGGEAEARFRWSEGDVEAEKVLHFKAPGYLVEVRASVRRGGQELPKRILWGPGIANPTAAEMEVQGYHEPQAVLNTATGVDRILPDKLGPSRLVNDARWAGVEGTHFAALWVPPPRGGTVELRALELPGAEEAKKRLGVAAAVLLPTAEDVALLYVGPKDHTLLAGLGHQLVDVVPVGTWIGPIVVLLMGLLRWVNTWVGNYGWSIVVLTVFINVAMAPLRHYSIANGLKMAKLSPEMKVIQERYRKVPALDPRRQEMQKEIAALYERHGMSMSTQMLVGCLPLLLTMPFLIAFYRVLQVSIELRGAHFLWIPDLSQRDPWFLTPVLMGASMFVMQRMTPSTMDPAQQRMMMIMPVVLVVMFHAAPAGLNLYWLSSNLCSVVQQTVTLRLIRAKDERPSKRGRKSA